MFKSLFLSGIALVAMSLFSSCQKEMIEEPNLPQVRPLTADETKTVASSNEFAFRAFTRLSEAEGGKNVFISPLSVSTALGMAYNGAASDTKEAMRQALGFESGMTDEAINQSFKEVNALLQGIDKKVTFTSANSLWHDNRYKLQAPFAKKSKDYFDATVQGLDFSAPSAKDQMNSWVKDKTKGKIDKIVDQVRPNQALFLINAIYFKGTWTYPFDKQLTKPGPFRLEDGSTVTHDFMTMKKGKYRYYQDASKELIDLPYGNQQYSMTILVPKAEHKVQDVVQELSSTSLTTWLEKADSLSLELQMPKFRLEYDKTLNDMLQQLGMGIAFSGQADFSHMLEGQANLAISEVKHKTFVEVNEEGTEAAAATSVGVIFTSLSPTLRIERPFVFLIREKSSNAILFIGQLMRPEK